MTKPTPDPKAKPAAVRPMLPVQHASFQISPEEAQFSLAEYKTNSWYGVTPVNVQPEDLDLQFGPFELVARAMSLGDSVRLVTEDRRRMFDLVCVYKHGVRACCRVTQVIEIPSFAAAAIDSVPAGYDIREVGPGAQQDGWLVVRLATDKGDETVLNYGSPIYEWSRALHFLLNHAAVRQSLPSFKRGPDMHTLG